MHLLPSQRRRLTLATSVVAVAALLAAAGCSAATPDDVATTRVLQSVAVNVGSNGAVAAIDGSAIYLDETTGRSTSELVNYETRDVVSDLPVRVTTSYRTDEGGGADLADLAGYDGKVEIAISLENLTVASQELTYDAAGQSRVTPALVGAPLSIAASTTLEGVKPDRLAFGAEDNGTSGVVSVTPAGDSVVQWATLLAPPQTEATTTFKLTADVQDFTVPDIDIAVQVGLQTDLSFDGVVTSAFDSQSSSELGMQQRAIGLVTDVNGVLNRAGDTISEVRKDLGETSRTLGTRAVQRLADSTESLSAEMQSLGQQLGALQTDLASTVTGTHSGMSSQLSQIVGSMHGMLGDTRGTPPRLVTGEGCSAKADVGEGSGTLYSTFLQLAGQLEGFATANADCKDVILSEIAATLGPVDPNDETCNAESDPSMTCSLLGAKRQVLNSMEELVTRGESIVASLDTDALGAASEQHTNLTADLTQLDALLAEVEDGSNDVAVWSEISDLVAAASESADALGAVQTTARQALSELDGRGNATLTALPKKLADDICALADGSNEIDEEQLDVLRGELVDTKCDGVTPQDFTPENGTLETRLASQVAHWQDVVAQTHPTAANSSLAELRTTLRALQRRVNAQLGEIGGGETGLQQTVAKLRELRQLAGEHVDVLGESLSAIADREESLAAELNSAFQDAAEETTAAVSDDVDTQVRVITERVDRGQAAIARSYETTIRGLRSTSTTMLADAKTQIDGQKTAIDNGYSESVAALDDRTGAALEQLDKSTAASTRDVDGASKVLADSLNRVILDLGNPQVRGTGILGAMSASAAKSSTADFQLALASQHASGFANVRSEDIATIMLRQAQFEAALEAATTLPAFHLDVPGGASTQTIYSFHVTGGNK